MKRNPLAFTDDPAGPNNQAQRHARGVNDPERTRGNSNVPKDNDYRKMKDDIADLEKEMKKLGDKVRNQDADQPST